MLRFEPHYEPAPWGGRRLELEFGRQLPADRIGEAWELVELGERHSRVSGGPREGELLGELWRAGVLGGSAKGQFPFLLKWLDTEDRLSVQVHPDEEACKRLGHGGPKSEAWYVAHADPGAILMVGHHAGFDAATLKQAAAGGTIHKWLYETAPRVGEMLLVPAGTLHAVGAGFLLLEVQQPSGTTFRVHDWGRVGLDGKPRDLHLDEAILSVRYDRYGTPKAQRHEVVGPTFLMRALRTGTELAAGPLRVLVADTGPARIVTERGDEALEYGEVAVAEQADGRMRIVGGTCILVTEPPPAAERSGEDDQP